MNPLVNCATFGLKNAVKKFCVCSLTFRVCKDFSMYSAHCFCSTHDSTVLSKPSSISTVKKPLNSCSRDRATSIRSCEGSYWFLPNFPFSRPTIVLLSPPTKFQLVLPPQIQSWIFIHPKILVHHGNKFSTFSIPRPKIPMSQPTIW